MFPLPLVIETRASATTRGWLLMLHLAACAALYLAALPGLARLLGMMLLGASLWATWKQFTPVRLRAKSDGQLEIWRGTAWRRLSLRSDSVVLPRLIVLRWHEDGHRGGLALPSDALSITDHRRLRVWLRWKANGAASSLQ